MNEVLERTNATEKIMDENVHRKFTQRQNELRLYIIDQVISNGEYSIEGDKAAALKALSMSPEEYDEIIAVLEFQDGLVADEDGNVNFIYPVSALETKHHVKLADGREFTAMCAIDALGAAFTLHQDTVVDSECAVTGTPIHVEIRNGKVVDYSPKALHALTFPLGELSNWSGSC